MPSATSRPLQQRKQIQPAKTRLVAIKHGIHERQIRAPAPNHPKTRRHVEKCRVEVAKEGRGGAGCVACAVRACVCGVVVHVMVAWVCVWVG